VPDTCRTRACPYLCCLTRENTGFKITSPRERSDIESTNTSRGSRQLPGMCKAFGCTVTANPGPDVRGSPSCWYFGWPIAFRRPASASA